MFSFLGSIPGLLSGLFGTINGITQAISNEKIALINATTDREKIEIQERIATLSAQRDVLVADSARSPVDMWMRTFIAIGPAFYIFLIYFWDKGIGKFFGCSGVTAPGTCGMFQTDEVTPEQWYVVLVILGFYFIHATVGLFKK